MAFTVGQRVRVTSQSSEHRNRLGTVEMIQASNPEGFNKVRIDGHPVGRTFNLSDKELGTTSQPSPVTYDE